ncbi:MAG: succinyl-diaminopimelate desuccinylase [Actinomycetota bacterium]|nr:succinyl-diaminopimelate desuccinylase [Actinomycetota bacterium]
MPLDLHADPADLTAQLVDIASVSGDEQQIADEIFAALSALSRFEIVRSGNAILARTQLDRPTRVLLAGHLDTVPIADNVPSRLDGDTLYGCGTTDMKSGDAMLLHLAATMDDPARDLTFVFYDCEEIEHDRNGLTRIERDLPDWLTADLALLAEPTNGLVEAGCQGTMAFTVTTHGSRAHSARSWLGHNAIHDVAAVLQRISEFDVRSVEIDGCSYREGLNAVDVRGGVAGNVVPDECVVKINFRFAPDRSAADAVAAVTEHFAGFDLAVNDAADGALPGLSQPAAAAFVAAAGGCAAGKLGWTDVARFAALGIPAVNFGPGDPMLAHTRGEHVSRVQIGQLTEILRAYLS